MEHLWDQCIQICANKVPPLPERGQKGEIFKNYFDELTKFKDIRHGSSQWHVDI